MSDRHTFRAEWHDYNSGIYFVTICANDKQHIFGNIYNGELELSTIGNIINECLLSIPNHHKDVELLNYVVMPNHIHIVLYVGAQQPVGAQYFAPAQAMPAQAMPAQTIQTSEKNIGCLRPPRHGEMRDDNHFNSRLAVIIRSFKAACSIEVKRQLKLQNIAGTPSISRAQNIAGTPSTGRAQNIAGTPSIGRAQNIAPLQGIWQRNYYEHIIRNQRAFEYIMNYVDTNIDKWNKDCFYTN